MSTFDNSIQCISGERDFSRYLESCSRHSSLYIRPKSNLSNYRPISVLSVFSRLLEKLAHDQLYDLLGANELLSNNQFAFQKLHSMITLMLNITDNWYKHIDERKLNVSIFLDLKKAFDKVDHDILL